MEPPAFRENIIGLLQTIASPEETQEYSKLISGGDVLGELICQWFDDLYLLDERHKGVISHEAIAHYKSLFDPKELEAMECFHAFLDKHADSLGKHYSAHTLLLDPVWKDIMEQAAITLRSFKVPGAGEGAI